MELIATLASIAAPVVLVSAIGYLWGRRELPFDHDFVTRIVTLIGAPALVFVTLARSHFSPADLLRMGGASLLCLLVFAALGFAMLRLAGLSLRIYLPSLVFPNIGNMGLPLCLYAFGEHGLALAMIYFTIGNIGQFTVGPAMAMGRLTVGGVARTPFVYAALLALVCAQFGFVSPGWLTDTLTMIGNLTIPLMLLGLGVALAELTATNKARQFSIALARLALGLIGGLGVSWLFGLQGAERGVVIIESAMPAAVLNYLFARAHGADPDEVAGVVLLSTLLSYVSLPLIILLAK